MRLQMGVKRRRHAALCLHVLALAALLHTLACLDLSNLQLTNITVSGGDSNGDPTSFSFLSGGAVRQTSAAADLATETELILRSNALTTIPAALFRALKSAKKVSVNTGLKELPTLLVSNCAKLETITFNASFIHTINRNAIASLPKLLEIHLSRNNVTVLYPNSFANLPKIHTLDLSFNNLTSVPGELFSVANTWKVLDFTRNNITGAPPLIQNAVVTGYVSFERNLIFEIKPEEFANAAYIQELRLGHNGIFTVHRRAFNGMASLRKLDLSDNVISVVDGNAFEGLSVLKELLLGQNYIKRLTFTQFPAQLERLELQENLIDLLPTFSGGVAAPNLQYLNLSRNVLWGLETNSQLMPYPGLRQLDLSWNRIENFTADVLAPINNTIEFINFDHNQLASVPRTTFVAMLNNSRTSVSLWANPGIGTTPDVLDRSVCPNGSVFETVALPTDANATFTLRGCIQCKIGQFHDTKAKKCRPCQEVSVRAFAANDGATVCQYCPYSSDLDVEAQKCLDFLCNQYCWFTITMGVGIPVLMFGSKFLLYMISTTIARQRKVNLAEQEQMTTWRMEQMMQQLGTTTPKPNATEFDTENVNATLGPVRLYDLPKETQETVLETLQEHFQIRKQKLPRATFPQGDDEDDANEWDDVEWSTFHMHRILSRNYHGEVFLGDYCGRQVVVKRLMTLRFEVRELANLINDIEVMLSLHHPNITSLFGTMWNEREHLCTISEYVKGGDLYTLLEMESMNHTTGMIPPTYITSLRTSTSYVDSFHTQLMGSSDSSMSMTWWPTKLQMILDVCKGLVYAHDAGVSHGDLRSRNVLVTELFECKLNDFSHYTRSDKYASTTMRLQSPELSDDEDEDDSDMEINPTGVHLIEAHNRSSRKRDNFSTNQRNYMLPLLAPEVLHHSTRHFGSDIYSCGILLIEIWFYRHVTSVSATPSLQDEAIGAREGSLLDRDTKLSVIESATDEQRAASSVSAGDATNLLSLDRARMHSAMVHQFMEKLRQCSNLEPEENNDRSFGTTTTSSSASVSFTSTALMTEKLFTAIEECLHFDPKKRPTAKMLVKLFQQLLDDATPRSC
ncbi:Tkl protein kinase, partial [Globisporangium splendens]